MLLLFIAGLLATVFLLFVAGVGIAEQGGLDVPTVVMVVLLLLPFVALVVAVLEITK